MKKSNWKTIGQVCVDSGTLIIADHCNIDDFNIGNEISKMILRGENSAQLSFKTHAKNPAIVITSTGYGDGFYDVEAREQDGRVAELRIKFI